MVGRWRIGLGAVAALLALLLGAAPPAAADVEDLDADMPTALEDAYAAPRGSIEAQGAARFDQFRRRGDTVRLFPRLQIGAADRLQASVSLPYSLGSGREARTRATSASARSTSWWRSGGASCRRWRSPATPACRSGPATAARSCA